jgi:glutathione S-transferase
MKLLVSKTCPYAQRAWITVNALNLECDIDIIDLKNKPEWFLSLTDYAKVPVLIDDNKRVLWESLVVSNYLNEINGSPLSVNDAFINAINEAWIAQLSTLMGLTPTFMKATNERDRQTAIAFYQQTLQPIESALSDGPYFNGEKFCMIDIFYAPHFVRTLLVDEQSQLNLYEGLPKIKAWANALAAHPAVKKSLVDDFANLYLTNLGLR